MKKTPPRRVTQQIIEIEERILAKMADIQSAQTELKHELSRLRTISEMAEIGVFDINHGDAITYFRKELDESEKRSEVIDFSRITGAIRTSNGDIVMPSDIIQCHFHNGLKLVDGGKS